jgi:hypothetical protein
MAKPKLPDELAAQIKRGDPLSAADVKRLSAAMSPKKGRRPRSPLKLTVDELSRAFSFALARADGHSYDKAREEAAKATFSTPRSINRALQWLEKTSGIGRVDLQRLLQQDREIGERIRNGGLAALTFKEIFSMGTLSASTAALMAEFTKEEQATLFIDGSVGGIYVETLERTGALLRDALVAAQNGGPPFPTQDHREFAALVGDLSAPIAESIAARIRGCINSGEI